MRAYIILVILFLSAVVTAQNFQGKATYKTHRKFDFKMNNDKKSNQNSEFRKQLRAQLKKSFQKTYTLNFDKSTSTYKQNEELSAPQASSLGGVTISISGTGSGSDVLFKNVGEKRFVDKTEISGKRFLIKDNLKKYDWELTGETKNIGNYTCYKATKKREETHSSFSMTDGEKEETKKTITIKTVAWYTPQIPVSNGPEMFWGLPGLILEIQNGKKTIVCTEIVINPSEKINIKEPSKGKKVSQKKFDQIIDKHSKEMMERFKTKRKSKNGNSFSIQIQG